jgi:hypothetical protein
MLCVFHESKILTYFQNLSLKANRQNMSKTDNLILFAQQN